MSEFYAKIIADSISPQGDRLTTIECRFPHILLPQFNKHRMLSSNAASSRAIGVKKRIKEVRESPFIPTFWGKNQKGMVAQEKLDNKAAMLAESTWIEAAKTAANYAEALCELEVHKQIANRVLEPFTWQTVVATGNLEWWEHLIRLRDHDDAQPEFAYLARLIKENIGSSTPRIVRYGGAAHLPYILDEEFNHYDLMTLQRASIARIARTSYASDGNWDIKKDLGLESRLFAADPKHETPYESVACPWVDKDAPGNFKGWLQLRHSKDWQKARQELEATEASG